MAVQTDLIELNDRCIGKSIVQRFPVTSHEFSGKRWWGFFGGVGVGVGMLCFHLSYFDIRHS